MTLIVKELVVRGIVTNEHSDLEESAFEKERLSDLLEKLKKEVEQDCTEKVLKKLVNKMNR